MLSEYATMAPTQVREPFDRPGWVFEEKADGWRMLAYKDGARAVSKRSARTLVLDGEVAIFDEKFRSRFEWLREPDPDAIATPRDLPHRGPPQGRP